MNCPICSQHFNNDYMSVRQHIINCKDDIHLEFLINQQNIICELHTNGYSIKEISLNKNVIFGRKFVTKTIKENYDKIKECEKKLQKQLSKLFIKGNSINDLYNLFNKLSKKTIAKHLHCFFDKTEFDKIANKNKNSKISKTINCCKNIEFKEKTCKGCKKIFLTRKNNRIYCSIKCSSNNSLIFARQSLKNNPPNYSQNTKLAYKKGTKVVSGGTTKWYKYKNIKVQGTYELRTCIVLDKMREKNVIIDWEYTNDRIRYIGLDGEEHRYLIDFKIFTQDGFYYLEVKGYQKDNDVLKWEATRNEGYCLVVWFNEDIKLQETKFNII